MIRTSLEERINAKNYYISELHMGGATLDFKLIDSTDTFGPYKSLRTARKMFVEKVCNDPNLNHWDFMIRGPRRTNRYGARSEWYTFKSKQSTIGHNN